MTEETEISGTAHRSGGGEVKSAKVPRRDRRYCAMVALSPNEELAVRPSALIFVLGLFIAAPAAAQSVPRAVIEDPAPDAQHPARMEVIHVPSGGLNINGVVYVASGRGPHPTFVLFHGLPGNEKNLDLAQAVRRAGWN